MLVRLENDVLLVAEGYLLEKLNRNALAIAREVTHETGTLLAGNLSNTWEYVPDSNKMGRKICFWL